MGARSLTEARRTYASALGELIIAWNGAENMLRQLLFTLCGPSLAAHILTAELGTRGLTDGLNAIAETLPPERREAVEVVTKLYERLREYRNYYVHGISSVRFLPELNEVSGGAFMATAKGKLGYAEDFVSIKSLAEIAIYAFGMGQAAAAIIDTIDPREGSPVDPPLPSRETLPLPDRLKKTLRYPLSEPRPPESSGE